MKKILLSVITLIAFNTVSIAQEVDFGLKAGVNFAKFGGDANASNSITGFHAGALAQFKLTETFSIQPEILFSQQGSKNQYAEMYIENDSEVTARYERTQAVNYINVPIALVYNLTGRLSIVAGPQAGFVISADFEDEGSTYIGDAKVSDFSTSGDNKDDFKSIDFSVFAGTAYQLPVGVFFEARYQAGVSRVLENSNAASITNNVFSLSAGFKF